MSRVLGWATNSSKIRRAPLNRSSASVTGSKRSTAMRAVATTRLVDRDSRIKVADRGNPVSRVQVSVPAKTLGQPSITVCTEAIVAVIRALAAIIGGSTLEIIPRPARGQARGKQHHLRLRLTPRRIISRSEERRVGSDWSSDVCSSDLGRNNWWIDTGNNSKAGPRTGAGQTTSSPVTSDPEANYQQGLNDLSQLRESVQGDPDTLRQVQDLIREMQRLDPKRFPGNPELVEQLHTQVL